MANFTLIKDQIIPIEGGYVWNKNDPGGETKYGISKRSYPNLDIKNLTLDQANDIYKRDFWDLMRLDEVNDQRIAEKVFWFGVHSGPVNSIKCLQKAIIRATGFEIIVDGIIGKITISFINNDYYGLLDSLKLEQISYYANIVSTKPSQIEFLLGWVKRALKG